MSRNSAPVVARRAALSLRAILLAAGVGALAYIGLVGLDVGARIGPDAARLAQQSGTVLEEFQESRRRIDVLDDAMTDLWRLLGDARRGTVPRDTLEAIRLRLQDMEESSRTLGRLIDSGAGGEPELLTALAVAVDREEALARTMLTSVAALELGNVPAAERMLRRSDSLDSPLADAMADATGIALRQVNRHEQMLVDSANNAAHIVWVWLVVGVAALAMLAWFLHRRLYAPLAAIDRGFTRIAKGDLAVTLHARENDELGRLSDHFNRMTAVLRQRALDEDQRMADETAARTRLILDSALDAVVVMDDRGIVREFNPQAEALFGWKRDELVGHSIGDYVLPDEFRAAYRDGVINTAATSTVLNRRVETVAFRRNGTPVPVEVAVTPLRRGNHLEFSAFVRDISERRAAEAALSASEGRYRAAFEQAAVGMVEVGADGRFMRVNRAFVRIIGYSADELVGKTFAQFTHPADVDGDMFALHDLFGGRVPFVHRDKRYVRKDGSIAWVRLDAALVRGSDDDVPYALSVMEDVSESKRLADELRQVQKMEAVGRLAGGIAHDFNNLLSGIMGYADLLQHSDGGADQVREDARAIIATARQGADLAKNLLTLARRSPQRAERVDLNTVVTEVRKLVSRTFDRSIEIRADLSCEAATVLGDKSQLSNALLNLAINAKDAMPDGGVLTFETRHVTLDESFCARFGNTASPGRYVAIAVRDTGTGMSSETRARVFEPFFTTKTAGKGTGLGLAMVYGMVRSHDGLIEVESEPGHGAAFTLHIPSRDDLNADGVAEVTAIVTGKGRVLVADDEATIRDVAGRMLVRLGYEVDLVPDGEKAVAQVSAASGRYAVVILDGDMPRLNGRDAAQQIRAIAPGLPLILASGNFNADTEREVAALGFSAAIGKPYTLAEFSSVVAKHSKPRPPAAD